MSRHQRRGKSKSLVAQVEGQGEQGVCQGTQRARQRRRRLRACTAMAIALDPLGNIERQQQLRVTVCVAWRCACIAYSSSRGARALPRCGEETLGGDGHCVQRATWLYTHSSQSRTRSSTHSPSSQHTQPSSPNHAQQPSPPPLPPHAARPPSPCSHLPSDTCIALRPECKNPRAPKTQCRDPRTPAASTSI